MYLSPSIVVGFHGCDKTTFENVIKNGQMLSESQNSYDWLGSGMYFWEGSYERALEWAESSSKIKNPSVIGAFIRLGNCVDLLDVSHVKELRAAHKLLELEMSSLGKPMPLNKIDKDGVTMVRELDCAVMQRLHQFNNEQIASKLNLSSTSGVNIGKIRRDTAFFDSVRGMFPEGPELYPGAGFREKNHIQLCLLNPNCIIGYFDPRHRNNQYKAL